MGSKKRSAWQRQKVEFAASLGGLDDLFADEEAGCSDDFDDSFGGCGEPRGSRHRSRGSRDPFAREAAARARRDEQREAAHRRKACERKNRYASRWEAEDTARECADHGAPPLHVYHCPYCNGWHLTSKPE